MVAKSCILLVLALSASLAYSQQKSEDTGKGVIIGSIIDRQSKHPVQFADVLLFNEKDSSMVTGAATNGSGEFALRGIKNGRYELRVQVLGYSTRTIRNVVISQSAPQVHLGSVYIIPSAINLPSVVAEGERWPTTYKLDKQVIDVGQIKTASAGNAADVLSNVPSVSVDVDGNVSLRGSTNFQVLIDGRPSVMDAQDALQQIPASAIKSIEISTNPTAKYDASGDAGIINIVLKKYANLGLSGLANVTGGLADKYGADYIVQYKTPTISYNGGIDFNRRSFPGTNQQQKQSVVGGTTSFLNSDGSMTWRRIFSSIRGGVDLDEADNLSLEGTYGSRSFHHLSTLTYDRWSLTTPQPLGYLGNTNSNNYGNYYELNANYRHEFSTQGHQLTGNLSYRHNNSDGSSVSTATQSGSVATGTQATQLGPSHEIRGNIDYTLPIGGAKKFSAGSEYFTRIYQNINALYLFDTALSAFQFEAPYSHTNDFNRTRFAAYAMYATHWDSLQFQLGFRSEYTYQLVDEADTKQRFTFSRWDYFPSFHASLGLSGGTQLLASYSRRINRPDGWDLEPYYVWFDANDVHRGNPDLRPDLIDSYDIGIQTFIGSISFTNDFYYRYTHDKLTWVSMVYAPNVTLSTVENVGSDRSLGYEFGLLFNPVKMWQCNVMGDVYDYRIMGAIQDVGFSNESRNWDLKFHNTFTLGRSTTVQLSSQYYSPSVTAQGRWGGYFTTDLALRQDLMGKTLSLTLQANDVLNTGRREFTSQGVGFYNYSTYYRRAPIVLLSLKYNFNNFKEEKKPSGQPEDEGGGQDQGQG